MNQPSHTATTPTDTTGTTATTTTTVTTATTVTSFTTATTPPSDRTARNPVRIGGPARRRSPDARRRHAALAVTAAAVMALTAACGSGAGTHAAPVANDKVQAGSGDSAGYGSGGAGSGYGAGKGQAGGDGYGAPGDSNRPVAQDAPARTLALRQSPELGPVVTDSEGMTLYRFDKDTAEPPNSACSGACATTWPPVPADDATAASGMAADALGSVTRADGTKQLTIGGWPAYRYAKDTAPGDTKGHGVGGTWNAFAPNGGKATAGPAADVSVFDQPQLGKLLVDKAGRTVYRFDKDSAWPMRFGCNGACLDTWKPVGPADKSKLKGVPEKLISTVTRPDGTEQLAVDCWPVYTFSGDRQPGDVKGQGKTGTWFAVSPEGKKITSPAKG
ncbi:SCO0930 family lipoprotein [Streptomyces sp. NPDC018045]|uniref:SCO0930 family lipoprotein n=1 Tax=Streptomyces sp. NPDC018045 TaxID=3365037 RepID=UPI0037982BA5